MDEENSLIKILKWVSIMALAAIPIIVFLRKEKARGSNYSMDYESNVFTAELNE